MVWYPFVLTVLRLSAAGSIAIAVVLLARLLLKKAPRWLTCALWLVVLIRLLVPISFEGFFGVVPKSLTQLDEKVYYPAYEQVTPGAAADAALRTVGDTLNGGLGTVPVRLTPDAAPDTSAVPAYHRQVWSLVLTALWPIGVLAMAGYALVSYVRLRRKLVGAVQLEGNVYLADNIPSPFVLGMLRPKIYLPSNLTPTETEYILLHERTHLSHLDHITRPLAFLALTVHWFNPLVWLAFVVSGVDMEVACDEEVLDKAGADIRADYAQSLLNLSTGRVLIAATPLAFGEGGVKGRVQRVLNWKKPPVRIVAICLCLVLLLCGCLFTDRAMAALDRPPLFDITSIDPAYDTVILDGRSTESYGVTSFAQYCDPGYPGYTIVGFMGEQGLSDDHEHSYESMGYAVIDENGKDLTLLDEHWIILTDPMTKLSNWDILLDQDGQYTGNNRFHVLLSKDPAVKTVRATTDAGTVTLYDVTDTPSMTVIPWGDAQESIHVEWLNETGDLIGEETGTYKDEPAELPVYPVYSREDATRFLDVIAIDTAVHSADKDLKHAQCYAYYVHPDFPDFVVVGYTREDGASIGHATVERTETGYQAMDWRDERADLVDMYTLLGNSFLAFDNTRVGNLRALTLDLPSLATVRIHRYGSRYDTAPLEFSVDSTPCMVVYPEGRSEGETVEFLDSNSNPIQNPVNMGRFVPEWQEYMVYTAPYA